MSTATQYCDLLLVGLVIFLCAPVRPAAVPAPVQLDTPLTIAVAEALSTGPAHPAPVSLASGRPVPARLAPAGPAPAVPTAEGAALAEPVDTDPAQAASTASGVHRAIDALTARLLDGRARAALPPTIDLGAIRAARAGAQDPSARTASIVGERPGPVRESADDRSVTGAAVAYGAPDAGRRGGVGTSSASTAGPGGSATAMLSGLSELPVHAGFTVARDTTRTGTIHASIQPLDRPG